MRKRNKFILLILFILLISTILLLRLNKEYWTDIIPTWLTAIGTLGAVIWAVTQPTLAKKNSMLIEKQRNDKTLHLIDSLCVYERRCLREVRIDLHAYCDGLKRSISKKENSNTISLYIAHHSTRPFGAVSTSEERVKKVIDHLQRSKDKSHIYNILVNYRSVLSNNLSSYHTLLDEKSIEKISTRLLNLNKCLDKIKEYEKDEVKSIPIYHIADSILTYIDDLDQPLYNNDKAE